MKSFTISAAVALALALPAIAQDITSLPQCAQSPILNAISASGCPLTDIKCICGNDNFIDGLLNLIPTLCTVDEVSTTEDFAVQLCSAYDVTLDLPPAASLVASASGGAATSAASTVASSISSAASSASSAASTSASAAATTVAPESTSSSSEAAASTAASTAAASSAASSSAASSIASASSSASAAATAAETSAPAVASSTGGAVVGKSVGMAGLVGAVAVGLIAAV
ncbi:hypothetical protein A1O1_09203 [Capronia coronata CBS 617.96]|uniref:CFEM domain-containing protein n=1 Tax=Capronia coronata CBS 617.96 TaxID=1182541 RepID=W9XP97_9EURO|nr:uncharacterized protein A1O1_09203 [Capronia coronata CBS 617.96]EXJ78801.1 hypothetical protein A1O1_09203 [Capronia coronata CBS 617.96]